MISSRKVDYYINNPFVKIIDIREENRYKIRHIVNAINVPYEELIRFTDYNIASVNIINTFSSKRFTYILYCDHGASSLVACEKLSKMGYNIKSIVGGFEGYRGKNVI